MVLKKVFFVTSLIVFLLVLLSNTYSAVFINEILANGLNDPDSEWVELYNNGSFAVDLTNWSISESFSSNFTFNTTIPANSFIILTVDFNTFNATYPNVNLSGIRIINITISNFNLADTSGEVKLYNSSGTLVDSIAYIQASGKTFENVSIGRYPDGNPNTFNLSTLTPGVKNDNQAPKLNKWLAPSRNNTNISGSVNITVNITDDTTQVNSTIINFNGTNFSMVKYGDIWSFLWNTSLNVQKRYNITVIFNDSYGKAGFDTLLNITVTNINRVPILGQMTNKNASKNVNLSFNITATDLDNDTLTFSSNRLDIAISKINNSLATISWRPTNLDLGNHTINFTVSDNLSIDSKIIIITVNFTDNAIPAIITTPKKITVRDERYIYDADANDTDNDTLRFSIMTNASGMSIDSSNGRIAFTPSSLGFFIVNVSVTDFIEIANQSYNLTVLPGSRLKITDVDVKVDRKKSDNVDNNTKISREAEPDSEVEFKIRVKNDFLRDEDIKIEDIKVEVTIGEINEDDDLEEESKEFDLNVQDDKTVTLKFNIPLNVDEDTFDVLIGAEGEDENGNIYQQHFEIWLEVEKEKHDLRFFSFDLSPLIINCNRIININYKIINAGQEDEENVILEIKNNDLKPDFIKENISIDSGTDDNIFSNSIKLKIGDKVENGIYPITANIYSDDNKLRDTKTKEINVGDCVKFKEAEESEVVLITGKLKEQEKTKTIIEAIQTPTIKITFKEDNKILLLVLSTLIFSTFFVFTAIVLYVRY